MSEERNQLNFYNHLKDIRDNLKSVEESLAWLESIHVMDVNDRGNPVVEDVARKQAEQIVQYEVDEAESFLHKEALEDQIEHLITYSNDVTADRDKLWAALQAEKGKGVWGKLKDLFYDTTY